MTPVGGSGPVRVAVQRCSSGLRIAVAEPGGEPWLVNRGDAGSPTDLLGCAPAELVLVHQGSGPAVGAADRARRWAGPDCRIRTVGAALAAAGPGPRAVLDVGHRGARATRLDAAGRVLARAGSLQGGARLDEALAAVLGRGTSPDAARPVREALSLLPADAVEGARHVPAEVLRAALAAPLAAAVEVLRDVLTRAGPAPVLLVGGVARTPLLAELLDRAGIAGVVVAPRPEAAAVLGALAPPAAGTLAPTAPTTAGPGRPLLPAPVRRRGPAVRAAVRGAGAAGLACALLGVGAALPATPSPVAQDGGRVLVQYGYRLALPPGWEHTGGLPERRRSLLTPVATPDGSEVIAVERSPLGYDTRAEPERARVELRAGFDAAVASGSALSDYEEGAGTGGRAVTRYRQHHADGRTVVDWFVVLDRDAQLSVGCRHTPPGTGPARAACALVVASVGAV